MAGQQPERASWNASISVAAPALPDAALPEGWSIVDYPGKQGKSTYAVVANGRRLVSGMTNAQSAARWARLLVSNGSWRSAV